MELTVEQFEEILNNKHTEKNVYSKLDIGREPLNTNQEFRMYKKTPIYSDKDKVQKIYDYVISNENVLIKKENISELLKTKIKLTEIENVKYKLEVEGYFFHYHNGKSRNGFYAKKHPDKKFIENSPPSTKIIIDCITNMNYESFTINMLQQDIYNNYNEKISKNILTRRMRTILIWLSLQGIKYSIDKTQKKLIITKEK